MYVCETCGEMFDTPGIMKFVHCEIDSKASETFSCCPRCGGDDFFEFKRCRKCGGIVKRDNTESLCPGCRADAVTRFKKLLKDNFTADEIDYLNVVYDGESFE